MFGRSTYATALLTVTAALALAACGGGGSSGAGGTAAKVGRGGTLKIATAHDITSFDQLKMVDNESIRVISQITEGLFKTDGKGQLQPWLATADAVSADGLTHTLKLRTGVVFSGGKPLTSKDVKFTIEQAKKSLQWGFIVANIKAIDAPDDGTVVLRLKKPSASLHADLALFVNGIVPDNFGGATQAQFAQHPVGTGPFQLGRWDKGTRVVLARNPRYWQKGRPILDSVELVGVPDDNSRVTQLRGKQADIAANPLWPQLDSLDRAPGLRVGEYALARVDTLELNTKKAPFTDKRVRQAVSLAIDRAAIVKASLSGRGEAASSFLAPSVPFYSANPSPPAAQALAQAKQLMSQAGSPHGTIELLLFSGDAVASTMGQVIQQNLAQIGLRVKLLPLDQSTVLDRTQTGDYTAALSYLTSDILDPSELAAFYVGTNGFSTYSNPPELAKLAEQASQEQDKAKRADLYAAMQRGVIGDYGFVPVQVEPWVYGVSDRVQGFTVNGTGIFDLSTVGLASGA
jgi:peptide/nickel transport system substrate-binding protein